MTHYKNISFKVLQNHCKHKNDTLKRYLNNVPALCEKKDLLGDCESRDCPVWNKLRHTQEKGE